ncbi:GntR family transcriptional regulator [Streptomyces smyrnaeus]|uniref:GntR family transcriptional regulator n=1 Tax=Streptomyces smyrnaeus TaxID=1387713 RepID=A0ABS3XPN8_9ACTN|nr:GntR family transcriptional regulator [Streptomyces smyrnaeus]MBO8197367.1 GntR family transcriptional regulator [Streptomyces smyrnaeus]
MTSSMPPTGPPASRREWVLNWLRQAIASGEMKPGERLVERELSAGSGVSRGPVREAIMILEQEGLVVSHPYRGAVVAEVSQREVREVLVPIRLTIERFAFRDVAETRPPELLDRLERVVEEMFAAVGGEGDADRLADLDLAFHEAVITASGHVQALQIWRTIQPRVHAYFLRDAPAHSSPEEIPRQHRALLSALRTGTVDEVDCAVTRHIETYLGDDTSA